MKPPWLHIFFGGKFLINSIAWLIFPYYPWMPLGPVELITSLSVLIFFNLHSFPFFLISLDRVSSTLFIFLKKQLCPFFLSPISLVSVPYSFLPFYSALLFSTFLRCNIRSLISYLSCSNLTFFFFLLLGALTICISDHLTFSHWIMESC